MDLAFSRRVAPETRTVDLGALLARIGATQAAGPTARAQQRLIAQDKDKVAHDTDPRLELFAEPEHDAGAQMRLASFAPSFSLRQPK